MKKLYFLLVAFILCFTARANYVTPNIGIIYTLSSLVASSNGVVTFDGANYLVHDSVAISANDQLVINTNEVVKFDANTYLRSEGKLIINPPTGVLFTSSTTGGKYLGVWVMNNSSSVIKKLTMEFANSFRIFDGNILIDSCIFRNNTYSATFGGSAINLFRSNSTISNSLFTNNGRAAIEGGGNIFNAPKILNNTFINNDISNANKPQINLGNSGPDTTKVIGNLIYGGATMSGGIGFYPFLSNISSQYLISNNTIRKNRYGITVIGGANINCRINDNIIDSNNIEGNSFTGGSGIAFNGGSSGNHQNTVVTNNTFRANLWGITILLGSRPNLGDLTNTDPTDDGGNFFINNTNTTTPGIDVYNNSPYTIMAQGNNWNTPDSLGIPSRIFDIFDDASLGLIDYRFALTAVRILDFMAVKTSNDVLLQWTISSPRAIKQTNVLKSTDGVNFDTIKTFYADVNLSGYNYKDMNVTRGLDLYYRIRITQKDGSILYSDIKVLKYESDKTVEIYPNFITANQVVNLGFASSGTTPIKINLFNAAGQLLKTQNTPTINGRNNVGLKVDNLNTGVYYLKILLDNKIYTNQITIIK